MTNIRVLVADDEPAVLNVITSMLARAGYEVTAVPSATEALDRLRYAPCRYDMVLTDHGMPGMTGMQLIERVRQEQPDLPILLYTGWGDNLLEQTPPGLRPHAVLTKPIRQRDLLAAVANALRDFGRPRPD